MRPHPPFGIIWSSKADETLIRLDRKTRERILNTVGRFARTGHGDIDFEGSENLYRQRIGKWRVFFEYLEGATVVNVLYIRPRESAYRP